MATVDGVRVVTCDVPGQFMASVVVLSTSPAIGEARERWGINPLVLEMLGTARNGRSRLIDELEALPARAVVVPDYAGSFVDIQVALPFLDEALDLIFDAVARPDFTSMSSLRALQVAKQRVVTEARFPGTRARSHVQGLLFGAASRFAKPSSGDSSSVEGIDPDVVRAHSRHVLQPDNLVVVIVGDLASQRADQRGADASPAAQTSNAGGEPLLDSTDPMLLGRRLSNVNEPTSKQLDILVAHRSPTMTSTEWPALQLAAAALASGTGGILNAEMREKHGHTYGATAQFASFGMSGLFSFSASASSHTGARGIVGDYFAVMEEVARAGFSASDHERAVSVLIGRATHNASSPRWLSANIVRALANGLPVSWVDDHHEAVQRVGVDEMSKAFTDQHAVARPSLTIVGSAQSFDAVGADLAARHGFELVDEIE
ncbi:M16 family metallopeptidase [Leifsonia sp. NPDC056824]|uniref:M16 family metallopeptidase n=1 Tax=Leifsonia sp. NPDC056824 TaxID=3345953 RepID=UPI0036C12328